MREHLLPRRLFLFAVDGHSGIVGMRIGDVKMEGGLEGGR